MIAVYISLAILACVVVYAIVIFINLIDKESSEKLDNLEVYYDEIVPDEMEISYVIKDNLITCMDYQSFKDYLSIGLPIKNDEVVLIGGSQRLRDFIRANHKTFK